MTAPAERKDGGQALPPGEQGIAEVVRTGWLVFVTLIGLVLLEYVAFILIPVNLPLMIVMNVIDAALIMYYFMHVSRVWRRDPVERAEENEKGGNPRWR